VTGGTALLLGPERERVAAASREIGISGLAPGAAGNVSARSGEHVVITPRGCRLNVATAEELVVLTSDGERVEGTRNASSEHALHLGIYAQTRAGGVVHTHSHFATVLSTLVDVLPAIHYSIAGLGGEVRVAEYATFGSEELARNVIDALDGRSAALLRNHGAVTIGSTVEHAMQRAFTLEWLCSLAFHANLYGTPSVVPAEELERVVEQSRQLEYGLEDGT
jgi:L-fuculose-phosphate aldolase